MRAAVLLAVAGAVSVVAGVSLVSLAGGLIVGGCIGLATAYGVAYVLNRRSA